MDSFVQEVNSNHMQYTSRFIFFYSITTYNVSKNFQLRRLLFLFFYLLLFFLFFFGCACCCFVLFLLYVSGSPRRSDQSMQPLSITALFQYSVDTRGIDLTSFIFNCVGSNHQIFESNICKLFANAERIEDAIQDVSFFLFTAEKSIPTLPMSLRQVFTLSFFKQNTNLSYFVYAVETL